MSLDREEDPRVTALREFCARQGWDLSVWTATQREPEYGVAIGVAGARLRITSLDSLLTAVGKAELAISSLARANGDVYVVEKHERWGWPG